MTDIDRFQVFIDGKYSRTFYRLEEAEAAARRAVEHGSASHGYVQRINIVKRFIRVKENVEVIE